MEVCDATYVVTLADPSKPSACSFDAGHLYPETPYAVALQHADKTLEVGAVGSIGWWR